MREFNITITDALGLHGRPAGQLVKMAAGFSCAIMLSCNGATADAKRILSVMRLAAKQGHTVTVRCDGNDEDAAAAALEAFVRKNLSYGLTRLFWQGSNMLFENSQVPTYKQAGTFYFLAAAVFFGSSVL